MPTIRPLALLLASFLIAPAVAVASSLFGSSGARPSYSPPEAAPVAATADAELTVRPDLLLLPFRFVEVGKSAAGALEALRGAVGDAVKKASAASSAAVSAEMSSVSTVGRDDGRFEVTVTGLLVLPVPEAADFWTRAQHVAALEAHAAKEGTPAQRKAEEGGRKRSYGTLAGHVRDPQKHAAALLERWTARADALSKSTTTALASPLQILECDPPGRVMQRPISVMSVSLELPIRCRLGGAAIADKAAVAAK